jgi:lipoprotein NlpI
LLRVRHGEKSEANKDLSAYLDKGRDVPPGDWVSTIGELLLDKISEADFLASVNSPDGGKDQGQRCEAWYYAGMKRLLAGDKKTAADYFSRCLATQQTALCEYVFAQTELKMLATAN